MAKVLAKTSAMLALALLLAACGGGSGSGIVSGPAPAPLPTTTPTPAPSTKPDPAAIIGLVSNEPFATVYVSPQRGSGADFKNGSPPQLEQNAPLQLRYLAASNTYEITLPGKQGGALVPWFSNEFVTDSRVVPPGSQALSDVNVGLITPGRGFYARYSHTQIGYWTPFYDEPAPEGQDRETGWFVYGNPTKAGDVPTTGQATFRLEIFGILRGDGVDGMELSGGALLNFDFARGSVGGYMEPTIPEGGWVGLAEDALGRYEFAQTVFSKGSTGFSGKFLAPDQTGPSGSFSGIFTGPAAAELMARFEAPFSAGDLSGSMIGFWIGNRD